MGPPLQMTRNPPPHPPRIRSAPSPKGEGLRAAKGRPYGGKRTGSVGWETQAQSENRSKISLCAPRAPVGPDSNVPKHSWFCAPEMFCPLQGGTPAFGVRGKANMDTECPS